MDSCNAQTGTSPSQQFLAQLFCHCVLLLWVIFWLPTHSCSKRAWHVPSLYFCISRAQVTCETSTHSKKFLHLWQYLKNTFFLFILCYQFSSVKHLFRLTVGKQSTSSLAILNNVLGCNKDSPVIQSFCLPWMKSALILSGYHEIRINLSQVK